MYYGVPIIECAAWLFPSIAANPRSPIFTYMEKS